MVIPLKKTTQEGKPYNRRAEVEQVLNELDGLAPDQLVHYPKCTQQAVPFEVLTYYLRHAELELAANHLEPIFTRFYSRLEAALRRAISDAWLDDAVDIREEIAERVDCERPRFPRVLILIKPSLSPTKSLGRTNLMTCCVCGQMCLI